MNWPDEIREREKKVINGPWYLKHNENTIPHLLAALDKAYEVLKEIEAELTQEHICKECINIAIEDARAFNPKESSNESHS